MMSVSWNFVSLYAQSVIGNFVTLYSTTRANWRTRDCCSVISAVLASPHYAWSRCRPVLVTREQGCNDMFSQHMQLIKIKRNTLNDRS
jgi:hypothetical protein